MTHSRGYQIDHPTDDNTYLVCMRVDEGGCFNFPDNAFGRCSGCGAAIYFRPNHGAPPGTLKICMACMLEKAKEAE